jgi:hypothetical protein
VRILAVRIFTLSRKLAHAVVRRFLWKWLDLRGWQRLCWRRLRLLMLMLMLTLTLLLVERRYELLGIWREGYLWRLSKEWMRKSGWNANEWHARCVCGCDLSLHL